MLYIHSNGPLIPRQLLIIYCIGVLDPSHLSFLGWDPWESPHVGNTPRHRNMLPTNRSTVNISKIIKQTFDSSLPLVNQAFYHIQRRKTQLLSCCKLPALIRCSQGTRLLATRWHYQTFQAQGQPNSKAKMAVSSGSKKINKNEANDPGQPSLIGDPFPVLYNILLHIQPNHIPIPISLSVSHLSMKALQLLL